MNPRTAFSFVLVAVPLTFVVACGGKKDSSPPSSDAPASASPAASTGGAKGLAAVPPKLAGDVQKAIACKSFDVGFDSNCADYKAYYDQKDDFIDGKADAALVNLLRDSSEKVRYLGAIAQTSTARRSRPTRRSPRASSPPPPPRRRSSARTRWAPPPAAFGRPTRASPTSRPRS